MFTGVDTTVKQGFGRLLVVVSRDIPFGPGVDGLTSVINVKHGLVPSCLLCVRRTNVVTRLESGAKRMHKLKGISGICLSGAGLICSLNGSDTSMNGLHRAFFFGRVHIGGPVAASSIKSFGVKRHVFRINKGSGKEHRVRNIRRNFMMGSSVRFSSKSVLPL